MFSPELKKKNPRTSSAYTKHQFRQGWLGSDQGNLISLKKVSSLKLYLVKLYRFGKTLSEDNIRKRILTIL